MSTIDRRTVLLGLVLAETAWPQGNTSKTAKEQVFETERAFAATMAKRDHAAFTAFLSEETVFFGDAEGKRVNRGKQAVAAAWKRYFEGPDAPFSWEPVAAEVLDSGGLALSTGPVKDPKGELIGTFSSIWRKERNGQWKIIFDKGCDVCKCAA